MKIGIIVVIALLVFAGGVVFAQTPSLCVATLNTPDSSQPYPGLLVKSDLSCATFQVKGPVEYSGDGYYFSKFDAPPGTYIITWGSVPGYIAPLPETKELKEGGKLLFVGSYNETGYPQGKGTIKVYLLNSFPPPIPHFTLKGPTTRTGELGFKWEWEEAPAGTYTITYEDLDDHGAPPPETKTLEHNGTITFDAAYGPPKAHVFTIDSKPTGAKVYLDGSLLGNAPIKAKVPLESKKHTIRCSLQGYEDYTYYDYKAQEPGSTTYSIGAKWTCVMIAKKDSSSSQVKEVPEKEITPSPAPTFEQKSVNGVPAQQPPPKSQRSFFFRFWEGISSFFRRLF